MGAVNGLNDALAAKLLKTNRVRADTIVVEANVAYPSDAGLLAKGVAKMAAPARGLQAMGFATRTRLADRTVWCGLGRGCRCRHPSRVGSSERR